MRGLSVAVVSAFLIASPAAAAVVNITVTGTVKIGFDGLGLFGGIDQPLAGRAFTMAFAYDTANPVETSFSRDVKGGTSVNRPSPILRGDVTIGGVTLSAIEPYSAQYVRYRFSNETALQFRTEGPGAFNNAYFQWSRSDQLIPFSLDAPIVRNFGAGDLLSSGFTRSNSSRTASTVAFFMPQSITVAPMAAAVPEPENWGLLIAGFGIAGTAIRRRDRGLRAMWSFLDR